MIKMKNKKTVNFVILFLVVILMGVVVYLIMEFVEKPEPLLPGEKVFFSEEPENWVYDNPSTLDEDVKIDVFMATEGKTRLAKSQQDYFINGDITSFFYQGMFKGNHFKSEYLPKDFSNITKGLAISEKREMADDLALMQITNEFDPDDGIINGFILGKEEDGKVVFYIFVDNDWKSELEFTNIIWGNNFRDIESLNERSFDFSKLEGGVYIDKLETDVDWYKEDVIKGGIVVGEVDEESFIKLMRNEQQNMTYMMVR